tara:strand:+ start:463 stop:885 length:423 start_codon:yes stop_codon:yes gene_type:complete
MTSPPIGIVWRNGYVRCCDDCFDKPYLIKEMIRNVGNIVPVVVLNKKTKKAQCYLINDTMTDFDLITDHLMCRKVQGIANYIINKVNIQKSKLSLDDQNESCEINYKMNYIHEGATEEEKIIFRNIIGKQNILESKEYDL